MSDDKKTEKKRGLDAGKSVSAAIRQYYQDMQSRRPLAWSVLSSNPLNDIAPLVGIQVGYPENYACVCASQHFSDKYCTLAEAHNYKPELCSYIRNNFGYLLSDDPQPPLGGIPRPDLLMAISNACLNYIKWFEALHLYFDKPFVLINSPHRLSSSKQPDYYINYVAKEIEEAIPQLEKIGGTKLTKEIFSAAAHYSREVVKYWMAIMELQKATPAPANFPDLANLIFVPTSLSASELGVKLLKQAYEELKIRVETKTGAIAEEKHRLILVNIPPWYRFGISNIFAEKGCVFPFGDYTRYVWATQDIDDSDPMEYFAKKALGFGVVDGFGSSTAETNYGWLDSRLEQDIKDYKIDGAVVQINKSCKIMSTGGMDVASVIRDKFKIPVVVIDADQADERFFSDAEFKLRVDAFLEMLG